MKVIAENIYRRGAQGKAYVRRRIPSAIRAAYPPKQTHVVRSLGTSDVNEAKLRGRAQLTLMDAEFASKQHELELGRASMSAKRLSKLDDEQLRSVATFWVRQVLLSDESRRQDGLADDEFVELGEQLTSQRQELGRMIAQGKTSAIFPALHGFLYLLGIDFDPAEDEAKRACYVFSRAVAETLDHQLARQQGSVVDTDKVAPSTTHPLHVIAPERAPVDAKSPTWDSVFETWRDFVPGRPKSTTIASQTPWRALRHFAASRGVTSPALVTPRLVTDFVQGMRDKALAVKTINQRVSKIKGIYKIAAGKHVLDSNPTVDTLGFKESSAQMRRKRRLPFDQRDLELLFGSEVYVRHTRSKGQSGEASYWIPLLMFYTGARPEEIAGLALSDLSEHPTVGWCFNIIDRPSDEDVDLFDGDAVPPSHRRTLKNAMSKRVVPVAQELIDLGLLRYVDWVRERGAAVFFPTLKKNWHEKLSGSFSKFFGRYLRAVGIKDSRKVLYSFRHSLKDLMEVAGVPTKYLQRLLGHTTGDGAVTDGYGSDLPFERVAEHFARIRFPAIPATPWQPGRGFVSLKTED